MTGDYKNTPLRGTHYELLGLHPSADGTAIRKSYRRLSKLYHPDTTELEQEVARLKFEKINQAYATLSRPDRRAKYDLSIGYSRWSVIYESRNLRELQSRETSSAYLEPIDRPLSPGEIFALFIMVVTFLGCVGLVILLALWRGDTW